MLKTTVSIAATSEEAARDGVDARIEFKFCLNGEDPETIDISRKGGSLDAAAVCKEMVSAGDVLAIKIPLTLGKEGIDVYGDMIPAESGSDKILTKANNVEVSDDGLVFTSSIDGVVMLTQDNKLEVFKKYDVPGDVDYSTGNLSMDGVLDIKGWIRSGFKVKATGEIHVGEGVEDATVESGANIYIKGGILGSGEGNVRAGGNLTVRFLENAVVNVDGDIFVQDDIVRGNVSANGSIIATGTKGRIRGGSIFAGKVIEMYEIGSPAGTITNVTVGVASKLRERMATISKKLDEYRENRSKMDMALTKYDNLDKGKQLPKEIERKIKILAKQRQDLIIEEDKIKKEKEALAQELSLAESQQLAVKVKEAVYSGTTVVVNGDAFIVENDIQGKVTFIFNEEEQAIKLIR